MKEVRDRMRICSDEKTLDLKGSRGLRKPFLHVIRTCGLPSGGRRTI
jgi:hypothetical protein